MKKLICVFSAMLLMLCAIPVTAFAEGNAGYTITQDVNAKSGETFEVIVGIQNNPGIITAKFQVEYDTNEMDLISYEDLELLNGMTEPAPTITSPYTLRWVDALALENNTANGDLIKLTFQLKDYASGSPKIEINPVESWTQDGQEVTFEGTSTTVQIDSENAAERPPESRIIPWYIWLIIGVVAAIIIAIIIIVIVQKKKQDA
jgi:cohesin domain